MSPAWVKTAMTVGAGVAGAACLLPHVAPYVPFLTALAGVLMGGAHVPQPMTTDALVKRAANAVAKEEK